MSLFMGLIMTWLPREWVIQEKTAPDGSCIHNLTSEGTYHHFGHILWVTETNGDQPCSNVGETYAEVWIQGGGDHLGDWLPGWSDLKDTWDWSLIWPAEVALKCEWSGSSSLVNIFKTRHLYYDSVDLEFVTVFTIACWSVLLTTTNQPRIEPLGLFVQLFAHSSIPSFKSTLTAFIDSESSLREVYLIPISQISKLALKKPGRLPQGRVVIKGAASEFWLRIVSSQSSCS